jgi:hypothetical protein
MTLSEVSLHGMTPIVRRFIGLYDTPFAYLRFHSHHITHVQATRTPGSIRARRQRESRHDASIGRARSRQSADSTYLERRLG